MNCLKKSILERNLSDLVWVDSVFGEITVGRIVHAVQQFNAESWRGKSVALGPMKSVDLLTSMILLDGVVDKLILLPDECDEKSLEFYMESEKIDEYIEGDAIALNQYPEESIREFNALPCFEEGFGRYCVSTNWLLPTSGTTGRPKLISHSFDSLTRTVKKNRSTKYYRWGSLYSFRRFAGLQVFLQSLISYSLLILRNDSESIEDTIFKLVKYSCNSLSATPSMWRKLAMHPSFDQLALEQITLGGEISDQAILDLLAKNFPQARITHIYASTEAGVGFSVSDKMAGFPSDYFLDNKFGTDIKVDEDGRLLLAKKSADLQNANSWIDTGDLVKLAGDRVFFLGRANGSINVGGNKVMPEEIESVIMQIPEIAFASVRARKSTLLGNLVEAAILPAKGIAFDGELKKKVLAFCRDRLEGYKVPAFLVKCEDIELTASGKVLRGK